MNPYLEERWGDVHARLASYTADVIQDRLPSDLRARMQDRVYIESSEEAVRNRRRNFLPDVHVFETPASGPSTGIAATALAMDDEPLIIYFHDVEIREPAVQIVDVGSGGRVVTTIEFVSRSNKRAGVGRRDYLRKRKEASRAKVNVVEIDLLRGGRPVTLARPEIIGQELITAYHACVRRSGKHGQLEYYPAHLRSRLPTIKIPLRRTDQEVKLDLQWLVDEAYRRGRYDDIDYREPLIRHCPWKTRHGSLKQCMRRHRLMPHITKYWRAKGRLAGGTNFHL